MATGTIKWFNNTARYGRVVCDRTGADRFMADVSAETGRLAVGEKVSYEEMTDPIGPQAINVVHLPGRLL